MILIVKGLKFLKIKYRSSMPLTWVTFQSFVSISPAHTQDNKLSTVDETENLFNVLPDSF